MGDREEEGGGEGGRGERGEQGGCFQTYVAPLGEGPQFR